MVLRLTPRKKYVNLEIKDYVIRYVDAKLSVPPIASSYGETYLPSGIIKNGNILDKEALLFILKDCVKQWGIQKRNVRFLVPDSYVITRKISIPKDITEEEIRGYIFLELGHTIHLPFDNPSIDYVIAGQTEEAWEVLLFAAPEEIVKQYNDVLEEAKLRPVAADLSPLSLYRLYYMAEQPPKAEQLLLLKLDLYDANISIFQEHYPVFIQNQQLSYEDGEHLDEKQKTIPIIEELLDELDRIIHFYRYSLTNGNGNIEKISLTGDCPFLDDVYEMMQTRFSFPVRNLHYSAILSADGETLEGKYYPSLGLGLKEV